MQITDVRTTPLNLNESSAFKNAEVIRKDSQPIAKNIQSTPASSQWQKDILLDALDMLENNMQVDNNHPLGRADYAPIESFEEALIELSFVRTPFFKAQASQAQANLRNEDIISLFVDN